MIDMWLTELLLQCFIIFSHDLRSIQLFERQIDVGLYLLQFAECDISLTTDDE